MATAALEYVPASGIIVGELETPAPLGNNDGADGANGADDDEPQPEGDALMEISEKDDSNGGTIGALNAGAGVTVASNAWPRASLVGDHQVVPPLPPILPCNFKHNGSQ